MNQKQLKLQTIIDANKKFLEDFKGGKLMRLLDNASMHEKKSRDSLVDCLQTFSNQFQNTVMMRSITSSQPDFALLAQEHLDEEYGHPKLLEGERENRPATWDAVLEASTSWFTFQMLTADNIEKTLLVHLVLESSANVFFKKAAEKLEGYGFAEYFKIHVENDEHHENMGLALLENLRESEYRSLLIAQKHGWEMLMLACDRIAELSVN